MNQLNQMIIYHKINQKYKLKYNKVWNKIK